MSAEEQTNFLQGLAQDLNSKNIALPSFPDVVIKIRSALEDPTCSADRLGDVAKTDPVLASRLLIAANSAFHNRAGIEIVDLNLAISRLGFETVRGAAISLAIEQLFNAAQHADIGDRLEHLWDRSFSLSSMCYVLAKNTGKINADRAFLSGLLHEVGKLYILTKARDYPAFLGDSDALSEVLEQWYPQVGKSIVEAWGFSDDIARTIGANHTDEVQAGPTATIVDVVLAAKHLLHDADAILAMEPLDESVSKLNINATTYTEISTAFDLHRQSMRTAIGA